MIQYSVLEAEIRLKIRDSEHSQARGWELERSSFLRTLSSPSYRPFPQQVMLRRELPCSIQVLFIEPMACLAEHQAWSMAEQPATAPVRPATLSVSSAAFSPTTSR